MFELSILARLQSSKGPTFFSERMESEFAGTYNVHFYTLFLLVTNYFKIDSRTSGIILKVCTAERGGGGVKYTNVCASVEMMR